MYEWWDTKRFVTKCNFLNNIAIYQEVKEGKVLREKIAVVNEILEANELEKKIYKLAEIDASEFIDPFKGDPVFE